MKVKIEFDLDIDDMDEGWVYDLLADYTYDMRTSRYLVPGSWSIEQTYARPMCVCGNPISLHYDSRDENRPDNSIISHPGTEQT